ncbi:MAG: DUF3575 domain-containing protein [Bacteroidaceae bacterium]|nr:DUF3575 domain-containing protein [Bacteroidaceae bacterium]
MKNKFITSLLFLGFITLAHIAKAQKIALKTNALYWMTASPNLEAELRFSPHVTFCISGAFNPISTTDYKTQFVQISPELRYWFSRPMSRHFVGITSSFNEYSFKKKENFYEGNAYTVGLTYGYDFVLSKRWNLETSIGGGLLHYNSREYKLGEKKPENTNHKESLIAPIKASVSFSYILY